MTMISYAQNGEDVLLRRLFDDRTTGFYIDVGAAHPEGDSVTKHFYDKGWHGINIEPVSSFVALLQKERPRDTNLELALSSRAGRLTFYDGPEGDGWSTLSLEVAESRRREGIPFVERDVEVMTLADVCQQYVDEPIDFLKVDVEGHEREVLEGHDWDRWRPTVVVVEATVPHTDVADHERWENLLTDAGYLFAFFDGINRFYVRNDDAALAERLVAPANFLDDFKSWRHVQEKRAVESQLWELQANAEVTLGELRGHLDAAVRVLAETRQQLAVSEAALGDTRIELAVRQSALLAALANLERLSAEPSPAGSGSVRGSLRALIRGQGSR